MALGAMADDPNVKVKIVPVGLSYFHAHRFRSRAVVEFGAAIDVPPEFVEMFKQGGNQKREAVAKFLDLIYDGLKTVTVRAPDYDTLMVRRLLPIGYGVTQHSFIAYPSRSSAIQNPWPASHAGPSRRTQPQVTGGIFTFQGRTACPESACRRPEIQSPGSRPRPSRPSGKSITPLETTSAFFTVIHRCLERVELPGRRWAC